MSRPGRDGPPVGEQRRGGLRATGSVTHSRAVAPVDAAEGNVAAMRGYAWKVALVAIVFCYPVASLIGRLITYIGLKAQNDPTPVDQAQMLRLGNLFFVGIAVLGWLIALISGMESTRAEDQLEKQLGRFAFVIVVVATVIYVIAFFLGRGVNGIQAV